MFLRDIEYWVEEVLDALESGTTSEPDQGLPSTSGFLKVLVGDILTSTPMDSCCLTE